MGVVVAGHTKDYAIPKFIEMADKYVKHDIIFAVDEYRSDIPYEQLKVPSMLGKFWATEIVYYGKQALKEHTLAGGYSHLVWQGIDCYYHSREDYERLLKHGSKYDIVGALVAGRNRPDYPVCRKFVHLDGVWTTKQEEIDPWEFNIGNLLIDIPGYIGSDATILSDLVLQEVSTSGYEHWHERPNKDMPLGELGPEEWFMYQAVKHGIFPLVDPTNRPYHAHEDGTVARYKGETYNLQELKF